jgi:hypothetical protein
LHCTDNGERLSAIQTFLTTILKNSHPSRLAFAVSIELYLTHPDRQVLPILPNFPPHMQDTLDAAISEQNTIGWMCATKGFLSKKWSDLAATTLLNQTKLDPSAGRSRTHKALQALPIMTRSICLGRNDALHKTQETADSLTYNVESAEL